jgi:RNA polymerase sigma-70 factor (ECF subfamily)
MRFWPETALKSEQAEVIQRARAGDLDAFRQIHDEYARRILNFIYRMVDNKEDAEDLSQNVFLLAFHELGKLQNADRFESWLYRIARNEVYQLFRRKRGDPVQSDPSSTPPGRPTELEVSDRRPSPQDLMLSSELGVAIRNVLMTLPPKLREVFILAVVEEKSYLEITEIVGRSLLSVKTDIFRARSQARRALSRYLEVRK